MISKGLQRIQDSVKQGFHKFFSGRKKLCPKDCQTESLAVRQIIPDFSNSPQHHRHTNKSQYPEHSGITEFRLLAGMTVKKNGFLIFGKIA